MKRWMGLFISLLPLLVACSASPVIERHQYQPWEADIGYTQIVVVGDRVYVSGLVSESATFDGQLEEIYQNLTALLAKHGLTADAIVKETIFTTDIEALKRAIPVRKRYFPNGHYPSASWVEVRRLYGENHLLEVEVEAVKN